MLRQTETDMAIVLDQVNANHIIQFVFHKL